MSTAPPPPTATSTATDLLRQLTPATLRARLTELDAERAAVLTLLRSAAARERALARKEVPGGRR
jgi:hypothetical protein